MKTRQLSLFGLGLVLFLIWHMYSSRRCCTEKAPGLDVAKGSQPRLASPGIRRLARVSCRALFEGDPDEIKKANRLVREHLRAAPPGEDYVKLTENCADFRSARGYDGFPTTREEEDFSIAYTIVFHKDLDQVEMLLRTIYRPQNIYCLHVDRKSSAGFIRSARALCRCFPNVFVASRLEAVVYAGISRLQADINCMKDLLNASAGWRYLINVAGQSFPLKTNREIVKILRIYNGTNDVEGLTGARRLISRAAFRHRLQAGRLVRTNVAKGRPPFNITLVKGSAYGAFSREFVRFAVSSRYGRGLLEWMVDVYSPDEYFWATLHHTKENPHLKTPGAYAGNPMQKPWLASYSGWLGVDDCSGKWVRMVCVFSLGDLSRLIGRKEMFANKFHRDFDPYAIDCLNELLYNRTFSDFPFDVHYYRNLPFVKNKGR